MNTAWRGPILLAAGSALLVAAIQFGSFLFNHHELTLTWLAGIAAGQIAVVALWSSWSSVAAWKRAILVLAYAGVPTYFVLVQEWWRGGTLADAMFFYLPDALLVLSLMAILIPIRWLFGYRLSNAPVDATALNSGKFRLAELFVLTFVVAGALTILLPGGAKNIETREMYFQGALLTFSLSFALALMLPSARLAFSIRFSPLWTTLLVVYLIAAVIAGAEIFCRIVSLRSGPFSWEMRLGIHLFGAGCVMSLLPTLFLLRFVGFRLMIGSAGAGRMTACDTARC